MTDTILSDEPPPPMQRRRRGGRILLSVLGLLIIIGGALYLLALPDHAPRLTMAQVQQQAAAQDGGPASPIPFDAGRVVALETQIEQLRQRVAALEARGAVPAPAGTPAQPPGSPPSDAAAIALNARIDALAARQDRADSQALSTAEQVKSDGAKLDAAANQAAAVAALTDRAGRLGRIQAAQAALEAGLPLGELPGNVPALDRYRTEPPPTDAALRLAFPAAAAAARAAAVTDTAQLGFWAGMRARAESLITIRRGDRVLVGNSQIGIIDEARTTLAAGDLAGTLALLDHLSGPAAGALAGWHAQAANLLAARVALARLAQQS